MKTIDGEYVYCGQSVFIIREGWDFGPRKNIREERVNLDGNRLWYSSQKNSDLFYSTLEAALRARREMLLNTKVRAERELVNIEKELEQYDARATEIA